MNYMTVKEAGEKWGIGSRMVTLYCADGRIKGAEKIGIMWLIPKNAEKPEDGRYKRVIKNGK
ncbi:MAG: DNA-binding protein [Saccharofermentanales bacterium]